MQRATLSDLDLGKVSAMQTVPCLSPLAVTLPAGACQVQGICSRSLRDWVCHFSRLGTCNFYYNQRRAGGIWFKICSTAALHRGSPVSPPHCQQPEPTPAPRKGSSPQPACSGPSASILPNRRRCSAAAVTAAPEHATGSRRNYSKNKNLLQFASGIQVPVMKNLQFGTRRWELSKRHQT